MCGIVGIFDSQHRRDIDAQMLERMNESLNHRGPDEEGLHLEPGLGLGHKRLSIIDLKSGQQPLYSEDRSIVVVYNGEIYNFEALRQELRSRGHRFRTSSDTEVIVYGWKEWGVDCVNRFRGMFAFALWDARQQVLFLARDRLGIKPLYFAPLADGFILFASELKAILEHPDLPLDFDPPAIEEYFAYGYIPEPRTVFGAVAKLSPGHTLTLKRAKPLGEPRQYWDVPFKPNGVTNQLDAEHEVRDRLAEAVNIRLISEVPLGAFLSGGVDSSAVVSAMAQFSQGPVNTCSIAFDDPRYNEAGFAQQVAERFATDHHVGHVDPDDYSLVDRLSELYDEPFADSSAMPTFRVCELARKRVTVALSGDGGDENLAGYRRYRWHMHEEVLRRTVPRWARRPIFGTLGRLYPKADWAPRVLRAKSTFQALARDSLEGYFHSVSVVSDEIRRRMFGNAFRSRLQDYHAIEVLRRHWDGSPTDHPLSRIQYLDLKTYLPGDILTKVDRASMAHSLEVRVPLLDHHLVEWLSGLPPEFKYRRGEGKYFFKKSLEETLPREILYRPKVGFAVPLASWFRGPLRESVRRTVLGTPLLDTQIFNERFLTKLLGQHESGVHDHSSAIWALLMFAAFQRRLAS